MSAATFADASLSREAQRFVDSLLFLSSAYLLCSIVYLFVLQSQIPLGGLELPLTMLTHDSSDFDLTIRQQPERARVAGGKEKGMSFVAFPSVGVCSLVRCVLVERRELVACAVPKCPGS